MTAAEDTVHRYLESVRRIRASGAGTERSFYPALRELLHELGGLLSPRMTAITDPSGHEGDFPDLAIYERGSRVLALPLEVKPADVSKARLLELEQTHRYATSFGGGWVLLSNLWQFVLAQSKDGVIEQVETVSLVESPTDLDSPSPQLADPPERLLALLELGTETRATLQRPAQVAEHLAFHAEELSRAIRGSGVDVDRLLAPIAEVFKAGLEAELDNEFFVPTTVQTLIYGLFAAWLQAEEAGVDFDWQSAAYQLDVPLVADVLHACLRPQLIRECNLFPHLGAAAGVLQRVDRAAFEGQLAGGAIEHFYEPFLAAFDPDLRDRLGVWYTPEEIAKYQVSRADHQLKEKMGISDGLADPSVFVLDPAVGTGTYLRAAYRQILAQHLDSGEPESIAAGRVREAAMTRIIGFEILPAAFVIAHLHLSRSLRELGAELAPNDRLRVYLTNSLTGWDPSADNPHMLLFPELEEELESARAVKLEEPVLVVLGNPPYEGYSTAVTEEERALVEPWITPLWRDWGIRKHRLNDLYVRFWRIAIQRIAHLTERGVISFITNRQWLGGRSYPTMRQTVLEAFDSLIIDDLHGDVHDSSHAGDQSIFTTAIAPGIRVGTAIVTATRRDDHTEDTPEVWARDFFGPASSKRSELAARAESEIDSGLERRFPQQDRGWRLTDDPAGDVPALDEYFVFKLSGVQPVRDEAVLAYDRDELDARMRAYFDEDITWEELLQQYPGFGVERSGYDGPAVRARLLASSTFRPERIVRFLYRPMDARWMYWEPDHGLLNRPRPELMPYWLGIPDQLAIVAPQTRRRPGAARPLAAAQVPAFACVDPDARVFPLWAPAEEVGQLVDQLGAELSSQTRPNIEGKWIQAARQAGASGSDRDVAEILFYALMGICASGQWLESQAVQDSEFPTVPLPADAGLLQEASAIGKRYAALVDPDTTVEGVTYNVDEELRDMAVPDSVTSDPVLIQGSYGRAGGRRSDGALLWNAESGWRNVPNSVWSYELGGFPPIAKMLSYRVGTTLTIDDRTRVTHLTRRLAVLRSLENQADPLFISGLNNPLRDV